MMRPLRARPVPVLEPRPALRVVPDETTEGNFPLQEALPLELDGPPLPPPPALGGPAARAWALRFTQVAVEVTAGLRSPAQVARWTSEAVQASLHRRHTHALRSAAPPRRSRVRSVHICVPAEGVAEVAAVVGDGVRCRAVAFRMEGADERWQVTALDLG